MNKYDKQAYDFLKTTNTTIIFHFVGLKKHFDEDKEERNVYEVEIKRDNKKIFISYGDSINNTEKDIKPREYDILACLTKYDPSTFESFCNDYGYDIDSTKAYKIYNLVVEEWKKVSSIWSDEELELLAEIN